LHQVSGKHASMSMYVVYKTLKYGRHNQRTAPIDLWLGFLPR
jgi:hypothetical protein